MRIVYLSKLDELVFRYLKGHESLVSRHKGMIFISKVISRYLVSYYKETSTKMFTQFLNQVKLAIWTIWEDPSTNKVF